jgi:hypothetical protein
MAGDGNPASSPLCPNTRRHHEAGVRFQQGTPSYKTEKRQAEYRTGFRSDQANCDYCRPPCPTCGHRQQRRPAAKTVANALAADDSGDVTPMGVRMVEEVLDAN